MIEKPESRNASKAINVWDSQFLVLLPMEEGDYEVIVRVFEDGTYETLRNLNFKVE